MRARAESAQATHRRILEAAQALFLDRWYDQVTLEHVAEEAGVSKQTVLRRFGSKEGLFAAVVDELSSETDPMRAKVAAGDLERFAAAVTTDPRAHRARRHPLGGDGGAVPGPVRDRSSRGGPPARLGRAATLADLLPPRSSQRLQAPPGHRSWTSRARRPGRCSATTPSSAARRPSAPSTSCCAASKPFARWSRADDAPHPPRA